MFKLLHKIENVTRIELATDASILLFKNKHLSFFEYEKEKWSIKYDNVPVTNFIDKENKSIYAINTFLYQLNLESGILDLKNEFDFYPIYIFKSRVLGYRFGKFNIYNLSTNQIIKQSYEGNICLSIKDFFFISKQSYLTCHSLSDGGELWRLNLNDLFNSQDANIFGGKIIEHQGKLYFYLDSNSFSGLVCLETSTGAFLYAHPQFGTDLYLFGNRIGAAYTYTINILDTESQELSTYDVSDILKPENVTIWYRDALFTEDNLVYFIGDTIKAGKSYIGVIDLKHQKLLWLHNLSTDEQYYGAMEIQLHNNRLYVLCAGGTLHIFEKED